jgi:hypothetical protein
LEKQLGEAGPNAIRRTLNSAEQTLLEHQQKLELLRREGGYTSAVEKTIRNVESEIETIRQFIIDKGL